MFDTVLIANRGEIAVRIAATLRRMGIRSVAVYSDADSGARHVQAADEAIRIGPSAASESYLSIERILGAARKSGAQAVHPGYGFLSENARFAAACTEAELIFIGPPASAIEAMGDKIRAKRLVAEAGVPVVPGRAEPGMSDEDIIAAAVEIGFPVLLKPSAGGGGKGMRMVTEVDALPTAVESARREALSAFGDDTLLVERFVSNPRHIEIQVLADAHGNAIHLGERECSLQRRHQKIIEEAPSPLLTDEPDGERIRERMGQAAVDAALAVSYSGAGTVEFIVSGERADEFFFMEMNTRLQVEHPVTELVTSVDLVEQQVRIAAGEPLTLDHVTPRGHAVEARIYAESLSTVDGLPVFLPSGGQVLALHEPDAIVRVDSGLQAGSVVSTHYDPMLAKYVAYGRTRGEALMRLDAGLRDAAILGVPTNIGFLRKLLADPDVVAGRLDTGLVERRLNRFTADELPRHVLIAAAAERLLTLETGGSDPWDTPGGWRLGERASVSWEVEEAGHSPVMVRIRGRATDGEVSIADDPATPLSAWREGSRLAVSHEGRVRRYWSTRSSGGRLWLGADGSSWELFERSGLAAARRDDTTAGSGELTSPMPGTVLVCKVAEGERVTAGQAIVVVEAMKMEHTVTADRDGTVAKMSVHAGEQVALGQPLALITAGDSQ